MVDQAKVTAGNGAPRSPTRAVAHNLAELAHDAIELAELQVQLLRCDLRQCLASLVVPAVVLLGAAVVLLSCVPLALVCIALFLAEGTVLTLPQAFLLTLGGALVLGGIAALGAAWFLRRGFHVLQRSMTEFQQNVQWIKRMFQRLGNISARPRRTDLADRY